MKTREDISFYKKFLENIIVPKKLTYEQAYTNFVDTLRECESYYREKEDISIKSGSPRAFSNSYSYTAQKKNADPESDFKLVDTYMSENGWSFNLVMSLSNGYPYFYSRIVQDNPSTCAPIDYYLYKITEKKFPLQGETWESWLEDGNLSGDFLTNEYLVKYSYGWHETPYGKLCIEQNLGSISNFMQKVRKLLPLAVDIMNALIYRKIVYDCGYNDIKSVFIEDDNTYYVNIEDFYDFLKPDFIKDISIEDFKKVFISILPDVGVIKFVERDNDFKILI